jgi:accessory gene regulator B
MISFLSKGMALFLLKNKVIDDETCEVCQYGFEIIVSTIIGFVLVMLIGLFFSEALYALLFYCLFVSIRMFTGGYHASTYFKCKLILSCTCLFVIVLSKYCIDFYTLPIQLIIMGLYLVTVFAYAPIEHKNAPMSKAVKALNRKRAVGISIIIALVLIHAYYCNKKISMVVSLTLFVVAFLMIISEFERRKE